MPGDLRHRAIRGQRAHWHYRLGFLYPAARPERTIPFPGGPVRLRTLCCADDVVPPWAVGLCERSPIGPLPGGDADKVPARMIENADIIAVTFLVVFMDFVLSCFLGCLPPTGKSRWNQGQTRGLLVTSLVTGAGIFRVATSGAGVEVEFDPEVLGLGVGTGLQLNDDGVVFACG